MFLEVLQYYNYSFCKVGTLVPTFFKKIERNRKK